MIDAKIVEAGAICTADLGTVGSCRVVVPGGEVGQTGKLVLRPEILRLVKPDAAPGSGNFLVGRYKDSLVTGSTIKHFIELENGSPIIVQELTTPESTSNSLAGNVGITWAEETGIFLSR
ncbi:MAG: TOBE domain-containing protein [Rhodobacteraceae bacterium]|nr:TOBE domain-containing protein [Paracoccaceae bacterium]